jgi:hypothetical protein
VDGIEKDLEGRAEVIRLNLLSKVGRQLASRYDVRTVPTVLVLDADSKVVYRDTGTPDRREVVAQVIAP